MVRKSTKKVVSKALPKKAVPKKKTTLKKNASKSVKPTQSDSVTVRMYCQGLGDCFLLSFPRKSGGPPYRVLIDCGVLQGTPDDDARLNAVAENILQETEGEIDLLIVTHEHWDHISGFSLAQNVFEKLNFKQVWMSWAENPKDAHAKQLKSALGKKRAKVAGALAAFSSLALNANDQHSEVAKDFQSSQQIMSFFGPPTLAATKDKPKRMTLAETMDWLRDKTQSGNYCTPGECRTLPGVEGVKVYVLGPPKNVAAIRKMDPTGDQGYRNLSATASVSGVLDWLNNPRSDLPPGPFDDCYGMSVDEARTDPFFRENYGFSDDPLGAGSQAWRQIDDDWLGAVGRLALQLDIGVNNTSLALAFELADGRTLIFPGDAQIGNWLSWDAVRFQSESGRELSITSQDLLHRAIFYKVGHHGSHNATRKVGGLEEMKSGELVAMIPTDQKFAKTRKPPSDGWKMPFAGLYKALKERTDSCIARADFNASETESSLDDSTVGKSFSKRLRFSTQPLLPKLKNQPLYVEYTLP